MIKRILLASTALVMAGGIAVSANAQTVTTTTVVSPQPQPGLNQINIMAFDTNHDGILSMREVGEELFKLFDQDHNGYIDNIEFNKKVFMTIIPMQKDTFKFIDYDGDGKPDVATHTTEQFMTDSHLKRFDKDGTGISAADFIGKTITELDQNHDDMLNLKEWEKGYMTLIQPEVDDPAHYNK